MDIEKFAALVRKNNALWNEYNRHADEASLMRRALDRGSEAVTEEDAKAERETANEKLSEWGASNTECKKALDELLEPVGLKRVDLGTFTR